MYKKWFQALEKLVNEELDCSGGSSSDIDDPAESSAILTAAICSSTGLKNDRVSFFIIYFKFISEVLFL